MKIIGNFLVTENHDNDIVNINLIVSMENYSYVDDSNNHTKMKCINDSSIYMKETPEEVLEFITHGRKRRKSYGSI